MKPKRKMKESTTPPQKNNTTGDASPSPTRPMPRFQKVTIVSASAEPSPEQRHRLHAAVDALLVEMVRQEIGRRKGHS
jgi:hypothetical protein